MIADGIRPSEVALFYYQPDAGKLAAVRIQAQPTFSFGAQGFEHEHRVRKTLTPPSRLR